MSDHKQPGRLYLIPTPIGEDGLHTMTEHAVSVIHALHYFVVENARTARRFIKSTLPPHAIDSLHIRELDKHESNDPGVLLSPLFEGNDTGVLSEAGCPGVADPGARLVAHAHSMGVEVIPLTGPSSIILALMGSGMSGQKFTFHGYLPAKRPLLIKALGQLERNSGRDRSAEIFIEAPYRNNQVLECALSTLKGTTRLCIACNLTEPDAFLRTATIDTWKRAAIPDIHKRPTVFLVEAY